MTFRQSLALGANVRKGEKGTHIVFTRKLTVKEEDEEKQISMMRNYCVFNIAQIDGLPPTIVTPEDAPPPLDDDAQRFIEATRADICKFTRAPCPRIARGFTSISADYYPVGRSRAARPVGRTTLMSTSK